MLLKKGPEELEKYIENCMKSYCNIIQSKKYQQKEMAQEIKQIIAVQQKEDEEGETSISYSVRSSEIVKRVFEFVDKKMQLK